MNLSRWEEQINKALRIYGKPVFGQDKSDLRQNCYVALLKAENKIKAVRKTRGDDAAKGYVFVVCRNELLGAIRTQGKNYMVPYIEDLSAPAFQPDVRLTDALESLPKKDRKIIHQLYYEGLTAGRIAELNGTSRRWVQARKAKILNHLKEILHAR